MREWKVFGKAKAATVLEESKTMFEERLAAYNKESGVCRELPNKVGPVTPYFTLNSLQ